MADLIQEVRRYYHTVAPFLEAELADRGDEQFWRQYGAGQVLELGCGSGRVTRLLAETDARVTGIDVCPELLDRARSAHAWLVLADMRRLPLARTFDSIVAADDPFSHLTEDEDRAHALTEVRRCLAEDGRFILDALWFPPAEEQRSHHQTERDVSVNGLPVRVTEHWSCDRATHCCTTEYEYDAGDGPAERASFRARYWTTDEVRQRFAAADLRFISWWGSYDREPWHEDRSQHLILEAAPAPQL